MNRGQEKKLAIEDATLILEPSSLRSFPTHHQDRFRTYPSTNLSWNQHRTQEQDSNWIILMF
jgi:hypothetical protein